RLPPSVRVERSIFTRSTRSRPPGGSRFAKRDPRGIHERAGLRFFGAGRPWGEFTPGFRPGRGRTLGKIPRRPSPLLDEVDPASTSWTVYTDIGFCEFTKPVPGRGRGRSGG